jgi:hypothetical protein
MSDALQAAVAEHDPGEGVEPAGGELALASADLTEFGPPDMGRILALIGLDPRNPIAHAVVRVCQRYDLDPVLGHVIILPKSQRPYITRDGYLHIAHRSGVFDGMDVVQDPHRDRDSGDVQWAAKVAIYRKDMTRPFTFPGRAPIEWENGPEMALARAERRALRRAFDVTPGPMFVEDESDDRPLPQLPPASDYDPEGPLQESQRAAIMAAFREAHITSRAARNSYMSGVLQRSVTSVKALNFRDAAEVHAALQARLNELAAQQQQQDTEHGGGGVATSPTPPPPPDSSGPRATKPQRNEIGRVLQAAHVTDPAEALALLCEWTGREITSTAQLSADEVDTVLAKARELGGGGGGDAPHDA